MNLALFLRTVEVGEDSAILLNILIFPLISEEKAGVTSKNYTTNSKPLIKTNYTNNNVNQLEQVST